VTYTVEKRASATTVSKSGGIAANSVSVADDRFDKPRVVKRQNPESPRIRNSEDPISEIVVSGTVQFLDFCGLVISAIVSYAAYVYGHLGFAGYFFLYTFSAAGGAVVFIFIMRIAQGYKFQNLAKLGWQSRHLVYVGAMTTSLLITMAFLSKIGAMYSRGWAIIWVLLSFATLELVRVAFYCLIKRWQHTGRFMRTLAIIGACDEAQLLVAKMDGYSASNFIIAGVFDDRLTRVPAAIGDYPVRGTVKDLIQFAQKRRVDEVIIALPMRATKRIGTIVEKLRVLPADLRVCIEPIANTFPVSGISETASVRMLDVLDRPLKHWSGTIKWIEDKMLSSVFLIVFGPVMLLIALAIKMESPGPVFFVQRRFGFNNQPVNVLKFRTMYIDQCDETGARRTVENDPRVTRVGRFLRTCSLDELPQFLNVLRGEMSIIGPRAHALAMKAGDQFYFDAVDNYSQRHRVRPGITGWAQVNGLRGEIDTLEKAQQRVTHDLHYIDNWSLGLDIKIIALTIRALVTRQNAC
jgi:Undecaprenyl-phosphate glucose phosphotransferase